MRRAAPQPEAGQHALVEGAQRRRRRIVFGEAWRSRKSRLRAQRPSAACGNGWRSQTAPRRRTTIESTWIDVAGNELLEHVVGLRVAERVNRSPELVVRCELADANRRGLRSRLQHPGRSGTARVQSLSLAWLQQRGRIRGRVCRLPARGVRIASLSRNPRAVVWPIPGTPQVLAQHRGRLDVEIVERDDPLEPLGPGEVARRRCGCRPPACRAGRSRTRRSPPAASPSRPASRRSASRTRHPCRRHCRRNSSPLR